MCGFFSQSSQKILIPPPGRAAPPPTTFVRPLTGVRMLHLLPGLGAINCSFIGTLTQQCIGIPFAAPPIGSLRWKPPSSSSLLTTAMLDATGSTASSKRKRCLQSNEPPSATTDEDCLYLDIYAPRALPPASSSGYPVVVWIHGGAYQTGSAQNGSSVAEFAALAETPIVWVGINYRMGWAGFLGGDAMRSLDPSGGTGNLGILDQRAAMAWVSRHIASLGGDPAQVTIDGCSAGAGSVAVHLVSPQSWPYFHRAAGESGVAAAWNSLPQATAQTFFDLFAHAAGCSAATSGPAKQMQCLSAQEAKALASSAEKAWSIRVGMADYDGSNNYAPVIDGVTLTATTLALVKVGGGKMVRASVPILLGTANDEVCTLEGKDFSFNLTKEQFLIDTTAEYAGNNISLDAIMRLYGRIQEPSPGHGQPTQDCGCGSPQLLPEVCMPCSRGENYSAWWWSAIERGSDFGFHCPSREFATLRSSEQLQLGLLQQGNARVYLYSFKPLTEPFTGLWCAAHCTEMRGIVPSSLPNELEAGMLSYWISFYRTGDPNAVRASGAVHWPAYDASERLNLAFALGDDGGVYVESEYRQEECTYWETLNGSPD